MRFIGDPPADFPESNHEEFAEKNQTVAFAPTDEPDVICVGWGEDRECPFWVHPDDWAILTKAKEWTKEVQKAFEYAVIGAKYHYSRFPPDDVVEQSCEYLMATNPVLRLTIDEFQADWIKYHQWRTLELGLVDPGKGKRLEVGMKEVHERIVADKYKVSFVSVMDLQSMPPCVRVEMRVDAL